MGKKVKRKAQALPKEKKASANSPKTILNQDNPVTVSVVKERKPCVHLDKCIDLTVLAEKIRSSEPIRCEDCHECVSDQRNSKRRAKNSKNKGGGSVDPKSDLKSVWICLQCGHYSCGGIGLPTNPQSHALRHLKQTRHLLVIQFERPQRRWCFPCNSLIPVEKVEENGENRDVLSDVVKLIKERLVKKPEVGDVEDVWFVSSSVKPDESKSESSILSDLDERDGYVVRGLMNLGNTCFFNSVLQNILAVDRLREYLLKPEASAGPLTNALKNIFDESRTVGRMKNVINPMPLFGCISSIAPQFKGYQQHDSQELLRFLLDGLHNEVFGVKKRRFSMEGEESCENPGPTFVDEIFGGQISSTVCCIECGHSSTVYESFLDLSLSVPTTKPPAKKPQPVSRAKKKAKQPPKRRGRDWTKVKKDAALVPTQSVSVLSGPQSSSAGPTSEVVESASTPQNLLDDRESEKKQVLEDVAQQTSDSFAWLDYLEPEPSSEQTSDTVAWLDYFGPESLSDELGLTSEYNNNSDNKDKSLNDVSIQDISESSTQVSSVYRETEMRPDFSPVNSSESSTQISSVYRETEMRPYFSLVNSWEDEQPLQLQESEVLLLPYKEENYTTEEVRLDDQASSTLAGGENDFEGFGDLFNEPETTADPIIGPILSNEHALGGFMAGNIIESDADEVDNSDSPVSVESCLAYFTKPEHLSDENGYNCERCLEILEQQRMEMKEKQTKAESRILMNGYQTGLQSDPSCLDKESCPTVDGDHSNGSTESNSIINNIDDGSVSHEEKINGKAQKTEEEVVIGKSPGDSNVDERRGTEHDATRIKRHSSRKSESAKSKDLLATNITNVRRNATKRFLIHKAPTILTIHIKRFRPDARGRYSKLKGHICFREIIDLRPYMDLRCVDREKYNYRLIGIVEHSGSMTGGHYVAYVRGGNSERSNGKAEKESDGSVWYHADDRRVKEVSLDEVLRQEAYILFYEML